ncbi:MAG: hypothetical protein L0Y44_12670 [Phycisphaerales bacterium]|nr:hypothetical protein [Phycisphaerales bacterium]MCI0631496.1 hypothetical protein [Phycisphaerales bacterium]MCI0677131.1 hypothetical protein [Phycisphaerales bacterium]
MFRSVVIASAALAGLIASASARGSVIVWDQGSGGNGHGYEYVEGFLIGWDEASAVAQAMTFAGVNGHLATITDGSEQYFINSIPSFDPGFFPEFAIGMWLGGFQADPTDAPDEGWSWVTGEEWSFTNWGKGEPNDAFKPESHLAMYVPGAELGKGWGDYPGAAFSWFGISGFLVEYDVPAPSALALVGMAITWGHGSRRRVVKVD